MCYSDAVREQELDTCDCSAIRAPLRAKLTAEKMRSAGLRKKLRQAQLALNKMKAAAKSKSLLKRKKRAKYTPEEIRKALRIKFASMNIGNR